MAQIATLYKDKQKTQAVYPRTKTSAVTDATGSSLDTLLTNKVDKVAGKSLSTNDYTTAEKEKLAGIAAGAQVNTITGVKGGSETSYRTGNVNITKANIGLGNVDNTSDANKPVSTATQTALDNKVDKETGKSLIADTAITKLSGIATGATKVESSTTNGNIKINGTETKVYTEVANTVHDANYKHITVTNTSVSDGTNTFNKYVHPGSGTNPHGTTKSDVGLGNVTNDAQVKRTEMGVANGVATLDSNGKVPSAQLPSYVDDVLEYSAKSSFPATGETGKIYVDTTTNLTYRWSGSAYVEISPSLALGETSSTAYAGDKGKANATAISTHTSNSTIHVTSANKTAWNAKYDKPSDGIPKTDLASAVQTSLGKADSALQSFTETDPVFKASAAAGITSANITSWNGKQAALVSGTNIKTINNTSVLGSGNIAVQPTLVSGTNIKTINNNTLLGSGNIELATTFTGTNGNIPVFKDGSLEDSTALPIYTGDGTASAATEFVLPEQVATINGQSILEGGNIETKVKYTTCTLPAFTDAGSKAVTVSGVTADSTPILDVVTSTTAATAATQMEAWSHIYAATTSANTITFYSDGATTQITVAVKGY